MRLHHRVATGAVGAAVALAALGAPPEHGAQERARADGAAKTAVLAAQNESLRHQLELAEGDAFYLLLDPEASTLTLAYKGAPLREIPILAAEIGEPRARHERAGDQPLDLETVWTGGVLEPPRIDVREEVVPPPLAGTPAAGASGSLPSAPAPQGEFLEGGEDAGESAAPEPVAEEVEIPKTPEELYPVPPSYEIRFAEGLILEVVRARSAAEPDAAKAAAKPAIKSAADGVESSYPTAPGPSLWERLRRFARQVILIRPKGERARLRVTLDPRDADRLFRSLPPDVKLLIRPSRES
jgi:hypothetical protein